MSYMQFQPALAPFASHPEKSRGRLYPEQESPTRTAFQRDRDRIVHSAAFRRLEYKTQVFVNHEGDHFRTRLTHSLEVAQLARSMSRALGLNEDLAESLALAHDLGHTPFGHAGEDALSEAMEPYGGFDHNAQTLRILTLLEARYADFDGLNLTWETLEGIVKHNGPLNGPLPRAIAEYAAKQDLELDSYASAEAQIASLSDDIAYNNHDIDDGLRAGLFTIQDLLDVPIVGPIFCRVRADYPELDDARWVHESIRRVIHNMVVDLLSQTCHNLEDVTSVEAIRAAGRPLVAFSDQMQAEQKQLKSFLMENMYRHYKVNRMTSKARRIVQDLFGFFLAEPECLPTEWRRLAHGPQTTATAQLVADYLAGMTDRFAMEEHHKLFDLSSRV